MAENIQIDPIATSVTVKMSQDQAFDLFVKKFRVWYPKTYTWSQDKLDTIAIEPYKGGRCFERGPHHFEIDWGRVLTYLPPERLVFTWQITANRQPMPDPKKASEVEINFTASGQNTNVMLEHRNFEKHREDAAAYREALASPEGWPFILGQFKAFVNDKDIGKHKVPVQPIPAQYHTVTPYLVVKEVGKMINFIKKAFNGEEVHHTKRPDGSTMHAEVRVGDSFIMIGGATRENRSSYCNLHLYVENVDAVYEQAIEAGSESLREPDDQFYGDRSAGVQDEWGNQWWIATHIEDVSDREREKREKGFGSSQHCSATKEK